MALSNKSLGNSFEAEFCEMLAAHGFWAHNMAANASGQPADVIAVRNGYAYLIDCKVCSNDKFDQRRIEENQNLSMTMWNLCGNSHGWFALKLLSGVYMVDYATLLRLRRNGQVLSHSDIICHGIPFHEWVRTV